MVGGGKGGAEHLECLRHFSHNNAEFYVDSSALSLRVSGCLLGLVSLPLWGSSEFAAMVCWCRGLWSMELRQAGGTGGGVGVGMLLCGSLGETEPGYVE